MSENLLSQEEIDALLRADDIEEMTDTTSDIEVEISEQEKDAIGEIGNISMGTAATTLSSLLGKKVEITTPKVELTTKEKLRKDYPKPFVIINVKYTVGLEGDNLLVLSTKDGSIIADLMMGGTGENPPSELNEMYLSAVSEAMNQMMGSASTSMSTVLDKRIDISPPNLNIVDLQNEDVGFSEIKADDPIVKVSFRMAIQGLLDSELIQLLPYEFSKNVVRDLLGNFSQENDLVIEEPEPESYPQPEEINRQLKVAESKASQERPQPHISVQPAKFTQLSSTTTTQEELSNLDLILDIPLQVSVELGRTTRTIKEILDFSTGSIIELDKLAGEPVDLKVNGKLFAKGEVVVIDENFGVRITDIVSPLERVQNLQ